MARVRRPLPASNMGSLGAVEMRGLREYCQKLGRLGEGMVTTGCIKALAPGAEVMVGAVRALVPVLRHPDPRREPGTLRNAIQKLRVNERATKYAVTYVVGIRLLTAGQVTQFKRKTGRKSSENPLDPYYGTILVYGKTPRTQHDFMRPAFRASAERAVQVSFDGLRSYTLGEIARLGAQ